MAQETWTLVLLIGKRHDDMIICLGDRAAMAGKRHLSFPCLPKGSPHMSLVVFFDPFQKRRPEIKAHLCIIIDDILDHCPFRLICGQMHLPCSTGHGSSRSSHDRDMSASEARSVLSMGSSCKAGKNAHGCRHIF
jgi:hypothetical protein